MTQATNNAKNTSANTSVVYRNKVQQYANKFPEETVIENPRYAEIFVRQTKGSYIDRVVTLPEMSVDHPVRMNMERWGFVCVARVYADSIKVLTYKGFYKVNDANASTETQKENGTIVSHLFGEDIQSDNGEEDVIMLNLFCFKGFDSLPSKDDKGNYIKDAEGKLVYVNVGHINSVSFFPIQDKIATERLLAYKTCAMPCSIVIKGLNKIDILKSRTGGMFTVSGKFLYESKVRAVKPEKAEEAKPTETVQPTKQSIDIGTNVDEEGVYYEFQEVVNNVAADLFAAGADDLPF